MAFTFLLILGTLLTLTPRVGFSASETGETASRRDLGNFLYTTLDASTNHPLPLSACRDILLSPSRPWSCFQWRESTVMVGPAACPRSRPGVRQMVISS
jgi:hypothetical protein